MASAEATATSGEGVAATPATAGRAVRLAGIGAACDGVLDFGVAVAVSFAGGAPPADVPSPVAGDGSVVAVEPVAAPVVVPVAAPSGAVVPVVGGVAGGVEGVVLVVSGAVGAGGSSTAVAPVSPFAGGVDPPSAGGGVVPPVSEPGGVVVAVVPPVPRWPRRRRRSWYRRPSSTSRNRRPSLPSCRSSPYP